MRKNVTVQTPSVGVVGLLGVVFIVLKLTGVIAWSWLWVLAPFWIPLVLVAVVLIIALIIAVGVNHFDR